MKYITVSQKYPCPTPSQIRDYLEKTGWKYTGEDQAWSVFTKTLDGEEMVYYACLDTKYADYYLRTGDVVRDLAEIENRLSGDVICDMLDIYCPCCNYPKCGHAHSKPKVISDKLKEKLEQDIAEAAKKNNIWFATKEEIEKRSGS